MATALRRHLLLAPVLTKNYSIKTNGMDTLALARSLESHGVPLKQAEAITASVVHVAEAMTASLRENAEKVRMSTLRNSNHSQEHHVSLLQAAEKKIGLEIEKTLAESRHEFNKGIFQQQLYSRCAYERFREEIVEQYAELNSLTNDIGLKIHAIGADLDATRSKVKKYCIVTAVSTVAAALAFVCFWE